MILRKDFCVALRPVACTQSSNEVYLSNLNLSMPPPKFVEEKANFDDILESVLPINGLLSGDKVKLVLINSKLPLAS
ncbi:hypothetical protein P7K49_000489 [Saguinus oedipus]|uniref:Uncharacterized protein n=1 Tax=Saguinus oedipus TaxID=9490 RepID=A0ABQ9WBT8_SAGOE|nr:hypothetical protein P7K49_000489 [Saguinus oedipus]